MKAAVPSVMFALIVLLGVHVMAQTTSNAPSNSDSAAAHQWSFSLITSGYLVPHDQSYASPTFTADHRRLHLEARYNYEDHETGSLWTGYNFSVGDKIALEVTPMLGVVFSMLGMPLPEALSRSFLLIGHAASGVALFLTGLILSAQRIELSANVWSGTFLKNVVHPLLVVGLILALPMDRDTAQAALLLSALPSGFFGVLLGLRYDVKSHLAGSTLIVTSGCGRAQREGGDLLQGRAHRGNLGFGRAVHGQIPIRRIRSPKLSPAVRSSTLPHRAGA